MEFRLTSELEELELTLAAGEQGVVGRSAVCRLTVPSPTVSRRHAELAASPAGLSVRDLGSTNGTFINGQRLELEGSARPGDIVTFGQIAFRLAAVGQQPAAGPAAAAWDDLEELPAERTILKPLADSAQRPLGSAPAASPGKRTDGLLDLMGRSLDERPGGEGRELRLTLLLEIAKELSRQPEVDRLLERIAELTFQVMDVDQVSVLLRETPDGKLTPRLTRSRPTATGAQAEARPVPRSIAHRAIEEKAAVLIDNAPTDERLGGASIIMQRVLSALCAPLLDSDGEAIGLLYVDNVQVTSSFSQDDLELFAAFTGIAAVAIANSRLVERSRREAVVLSNFQRYFAPRLARQIAEQEGEIAVGGEKRQAVILFSDIRGFTTLSEDLRPDEIATLLNDYFTEMVSIVFEHDGVLDKFIGDAVMALWGAPIHHRDDADRAVAAAVEMQRALVELNSAWASQGRPEIGVGIGINLGEVFAGNIGSDQRLEYTVIGDPVNTASRLCAQAAAGEILVSDRLLGSLAEAPPSEQLDRLRLKGKAQEVTVHRLRWRGE